MLARPQRLRRSRDIGRVATKGTWKASPNITVRVLPNNLAITRAAVIISKKVDKRATVRNRCRRRLQEALRLQFPRLTPGFDILVYIRKDLRELSSVSLIDELKNSLRRIGVVGELER